MTLFTVLVTPWLPQHIQSPREQAKGDSYCCLKSVKEGYREDRHTYFFEIYSEE